MSIYVYRCVFCLHLSLVLHHHSPWQGDSPTTPRILCKLLNANATLAIHYNSWCQHLVLECKVKVEIGDIA